MMTRRVFLRNGSLALVSLGFAPAFLTRTVRAAGARQKVLVAIFQRGAVDGLSMVVPFGEKAYYQARTSIAIPEPTDPQGAVDLDGFFGLHPRLAPFAPLFKRGELAIVHACGSPDETRSHFDAQDYMESGTPGVKSTRDGWLNRYLHEREHRDASPFRAVALSPQLPRTLQGPAPALAISQIGQFGIRAGRNTDTMESVFESEYAQAANTLLGSTGREAFDAVKMLQDANPAAYTPAPGADYPASAFGNALKQVAQLIKANLGLEVAFAELGGWDTHVQQGNGVGQLANRLDDFSRSITAFATDMGDGMSDVVLVTMSEFGRAVHENGNRGTDHGHGNVIFVLGGPVKGGKVYGRWPGLQSGQLWQNRDLAITTDFRDVFGEIVTRHLGARDISPIFPGYAYRGTLGFI
jgi:uncharacterized protein (DUF1501 family)